MNKPNNLSDRDVEPLAYFWSMFWCATVLDPRNCQLYRSTMVSLGFVKPRGRLALTAAGKRVMAYCKADGRPRYPAKARKKSAV